MKGPYAIKKRLSTYGDDPVVYTEVFDGAEVRRWFTYTRGLDGVAENQERAENWVKRAEQLEAMVDLEEIIG